VDLTAERRRQHPDSMFSSPWLPPLGVLPFSLYFLVWLVTPGIILMLYSLWTSGFFTVVRELTLSNYAEILSSPLDLFLLGKSIGVGLLVACILTVISFVVAYAITFRLGKWGQRVLIMVVASLLASYLVRIYAWETILGTHGLINRVLIKVGIVDQPLAFLLYGYFAIIVTLIYVWLPIPVLVTYAGMQNIDPRVLEASRDLGAGRIATLRGVALPLAMPAVRVAFALSFVLSTADYITPSLVGGVSGQMVGSAINNYFGGAGNFPKGAALAIVLIAAMVLTLAVAEISGRALGRVVNRAARALSRRKRSQANQSGFRAALTRMGKDFPFTQVGTVLALVFLFSPLFVVLLFSFNDSRIPGLPLVGLTTHWYGQAITSPDFLQVLKTSLVVMAIAVPAGLLIGVPAAFAVVRRQFLLRVPLIVALFGPLAIPGIVIGIALLATLTLLNIPLGAQATAAAHTLLVIPFIVLVARAALQDMDPNLEEAARDLGSGRGRVLRTITLPLLLPSILGAGLLSAAVSLDEILVTNFTSGTEPTLPVWILGRIRRDLSPAINAVAVMVLLTSLLLIATAAIVLRLKRATDLAAAIAADHAELGR
jgi:ABC-type spermidine/putrescine transport system permease subunit II